MSDLYNLTNKNFLLYAAKNYKNVNISSTSEFHDDIKRVIYIKRIFLKYKKSGELKERLILNHLIVLYNVFEEDAINRILFLKLSTQLSLLKPFLVFLNKLPYCVYKINNMDIFTSEIVMENDVIHALRRFRYESKNR